MVKKLVIRQRKDRGQRGPQGDDGLSAYEIWIDAGHEGSYEDFLRSLKGPAGPRGEKGSRGARGYAGASGAAGATGPQGPAGSTDPRSTTITRDSNGRILSAAVEGGSTWTVARNADGSVASLSDASTSVSVDRDIDNVLTGTTVTET